MGRSGIDVLGVGGDRDDFKEDEEEVERRGGRR